jgi:hypothetical protein
VRVFNCCVLPLCVEVLLSHVHAFLNSFFFSRKSPKTDKDLYQLTEETESGILREYSYDGIPDLQFDEGASRDLGDDLPAPTSTKPSNNPVSDFWKMVFSMLFLSWVNNNKKQKRLANGASTKTSSPVDDSMPVVLN